MAGECIQPSKESPEGDKQINFGVASKFEVSHDRSNEVGLIRKHQKEVVAPRKSEVPVKQALFRGHTNQQKSEKGKQKFLGRLTNAK